VSYVFTEEAEAELAEAASFCTQKFGASVRERFLETFEAKLELLAQYPGLGTTTSRGRRLFPIGRYPFSSCTVLKEKSSASVPWLTTAGGPNIGPGASRPGSATVSAGTVRTEVTLD
jgi:plasmid stabilization system protein ParE